MDDFYEDKILLIAGGVGSIGRELIINSLKLNPRSIRVLDNNETGLFELDQELNSNKLRFFIGDIRDKNRLKRAIEGADVVFNAAALKHVPLCEYNPFEAVKTNVIGTQNLIDVAMDEEIDKFITISTDKSVNPHSVMGATKLLAERLTISANYYKGERKTAFSCVRFGNVLGTRGSVVPLFHDQLKNEKRITVTDPDMTRFIMSVSQAVKLVLRVARISVGGEIFILKMPALKVYDLAEALISQHSKKMGIDANEVSIHIIGKRPGEKLHEELMTIDESCNAYENDEYYVVLPKDYVLDDVQQDVYGNVKLAHEINYSSNIVNQLNKDEISALIKELNL